MIAAIGAPGDLDEAEAVQRRQPVHARGRLAQRLRVLDRPALEQGAVDVEEQEERAAQRRRSRPGSSRRTKAAISFAALSTSSSCTISTGECM